MDISESSIQEALVKKAVGYDADDEVSEFGIDDEGREVLLKRKVTKKHYSPDMSAIKLLLEKYHSELEQAYENMSDEELIREKSRLLQLLEEENKSANRKVQASDQV